MAKKLGIDPGQVRVVSPFVGGAFGAKGQLTPRTGLIALAAKRLNRPVKLVASRDQGFTIATYRAETRHHIRLGAKADGKLVGYSHEGWEISSRRDPYCVAGVEDSARLYAFGAVRTKVNIVHADRNTPGFMRSPPVVPYIYALETRDGRARGQAAHGPGGIPARQRHHDRSDFRQAVFEPLADAMLRRSRRRLRLEAARPAPRLDA